MQNDDGTPSGARFFDADKRDRGSAGRVTRRTRALEGLTVLEVSAAEPALASFLTALDKSRLRVQHTGTIADSYVFKWASGYENGTLIRVQGVLEPPL